MALDRHRGSFERFADLVISAAYAAVSGLSPVPDGTQVELGRINAAGAVTRLATTTTAGGRYSFNLTSFGLDFSSDLVVRVANTVTGAQMRAHVAGANVNLDPVSEAAVRLVLEHLALFPGTSLSHFTLQELRDLMGGLEVLTTINQIPVGLTVEAAVTAIQQTAAANAGLMAFVSAASAVGETTQGPGDIGNYFPFAQGNVWRFQGMKSANGQPPLNFANNIVMAGTKAVGTAGATISTETNLDGLGREEEEYQLKNSRGITIHGNNDATDSFTAQLIPFQVLRFPLVPGATFESVNKKGLNFGDLDGDGRSEAGDALSHVSVIALETVVVPAGTFANSARIETNLVSTVTLSSDGTKVTVTVTQTDWLAPGIGPIKRQVQTSAQGFNETVTQELVKFIPEFSFATVSAGGVHACGVITSGAAYCWGQNANGKLGDGTTTDRTTPVAVVGGLTFSSISAGSEHTCGVTGNGTAYCWGSGAGGALGNGATAASSVPVAVSGGLSFTSIDTGFAHTCGVTTGGVAYCWGEGGFGQLGDGTAINSNTPLAVSGGLMFASISAGTQHTCGVTTNGAAYCWGHNSLGNASTTTSATPVLVAGGLAFASVAAGTNHSCGITTHGAGYCWGFGDFGHLGNGSPTSSTTPVPVVGGLVLASQSVGSNHSCSVSINATAYCWGDNHRGQFGDGGAGLGSATPVSVSGGLAFALVSVGNASSCAVNTAGTAYCWGANSFGQLGIDTTSDVLAPVRVSPPM